MIVSFKHDGLEAFHDSGNKSGIQASHAKRLKLILQALDTATIVQDMDLPGWKLHELKGNKKGIWSAKVNGSWRVTFRFQNGNAEIVNYEDYH